MWNRRRSSSRIALILVPMVAGSLAVGAALPAAAAPPSAIGDSREFASEADRIDHTATTAIDPRLELAGHYLSIHDGIATFDYRAAREAGLEGEFADEFAFGYWSAGGIVLGGNPAYVAAKPQPAAQALASCAGRNQAWADGWGAHVEMDTCKIDVVTNNAGGGVAGLGAIAATLQFIPGVGQAIGASLAAVAGALGIGSSLLHGCGFPNGYAVGATAHLTPGFWCGTQS
jgi:hypothetical protein